MFLLLRSVFVFDHYPSENHLTVVEDCVSWSCVVRGFVFCKVSLGKVVLGEGQVKSNSVTPVK